MKFHATLHTMKTLLLLLMFFVSCKSDYAQKSKIYVDDIEYNAQIDNPNFNLCGDRPFKYFNNSEGIEYYGDKPALEKAFKEKYRGNSVPKESGLIRIRFIVNCQGEAGRFRLIEMDENYNEKTFNSAITQQLMHITKGLNIWKPKQINGEIRDYYMYLIFKLKDGEIVKILP